jgi:hypothetical protein
MHERMGIIVPEGLGDEQRGRGGVADQRGHEGDDVDSGTGATVEPNDGDGGLHARAQAR